MSVAATHGAEQFMQIHQKQFSGLRVLKDKENTTPRREMVVQRTKPDQNSTGRNKMKRKNSSLNGNQ